MSTYQSLAQIQKDLLEQTLNCEALVKNYLQKISAGKHLNAFLEIFDVDALDAARRIDQLIANGNQPGKLFGLVLSIKDNICYKNHHSFAASKILNGFESIYSATAVARLLEEDAIIIGRTNCDEFGMGSSNENSAFKHVLNPIDEAYVPGGSSGGAAASVKAGMCLAALGSDTGGSIRQPASFCGLVGLKPTYGRVSRYGLIAYASSFDQIGPLANNVTDIARMMEVIEGFDDHDGTSSTHPINAYLKNSQPGKAKIAYFPETIEHKELDEEVKKHFENEISFLEKSGHQVDAATFPYLEYLIPAYYVLTTAEASSNLARYDGVHFGQRGARSGDLEELYTTSRTEGFGKEVKNRIMLGTFVLSSGYYDAYYTKAQQVRRILRDHIESIFSEYDFIMMPTAPGAAFRLGEKNADPVEMYLADIYTVLANLTGMPAISLPLYQHKSGMPMGLQLMANRFEENKLLTFSNWRMNHNS